MNGVSSENKGDSISSPGRSLFKDLKGFFVDPIPGPNRYDFNDSILYPVNNPEPAHSKAAQSGQFFFKGFPFFGVHQNNA
jgi:hypothetical protein